ncbi:acyltransferase Pun1-like [Capsicum annuum]|uniref:acyltransferase Pun1-like n=1 Tax=Capsicum annuum TaxID=4072 RepID=UPI001FB0A2D3|nr:acyltransferase Pun1-like [Capsicum annuum]
MNPTWAALTRSSSTIRASPYFVEDSILSSPIGPLVSPIMGSDMDKCVQKRFIFSSTKLSALKSSIGMQNVTSSEAVSALLYKCAAFSAITNNSGNIFSIFSSPIYHKKEELKLSKLVADIKKSKNNLSTRKNVEENELAIEMLDAYRTGESIFHKRKCDVYSSSSLCKFPFIQDLDFGFGKPIRASMAKGPFNKAMFLMRTNDGGIEALVNLNEEEMSVFEHDEHLLQFAAPVNYEQQ